ncbi:sensor histidine kinase [Micromonospora maris]|uniref:histidine kinase n=1 Tax=Micromonospora maris TaxID=1003110 RepID=A0A9X0I756_9ACTN|nr:HAMP domain-containing sensor histidine kinase [Micromonospora maris]AEB42703.1 histidine kinase [Micromonospora maris AB-18-032]KUJ48132.1 histidine kinase [Micromonospora maris]
MKRLTLRARLTLVYGGLFLLAGIVLLGVTYVLVEQRTSQSLQTDFSDLRTVTTPRALPTEQDFERVRLLVQNVQREAKRDALESLLTQGGLALVVVSAAAVAIGWLIAGRALQPLHQITGTARRIAGADSAGRGLHERIALTGPRDEVRELADTFDQMLERLDRSFDGQRRFVANASHELRTPLTLNRALVELAVSRPDAPAEVRRLGEALLSVNERHERLIDGLLTLADSENELTERAGVDLAEIAAYVLDQAGTASPGIPVRRSLDPARTVGDPVLLERLTFNLVENALRHNVPVDGWVEVRTGVVAGRPTLVVINTGPAVPGYDVETMFQPFRRLSRERVAGGRGFGLGLSIVRAVARAHGGTAEAEPRSGGGLTVTVTLPPA